MMRRTLLVLDVAAKLALFVLLLHAVANPELPQYAEKAMTARAVAYPFAVLALPAAWALFWRRRPFPVVSDLLVTSVFLIDTVGNALDLYDSIDWWDDANHFGNWILLAAAFVALGWPQRATYLTRVALGAGVGAMAAIVWELLEYVTFVPGSAEAATAYRDTLGDLGLGLMGAFVGASIAARTMQEREPRTV